MSQAVIESGFARVGAGDWLVSRTQPVAFHSSLRRLPRRGWRVRDRSELERVETNGDAVCADSQRPFLTHIPCAAPIRAVSSKVLVAPAVAWSGAETLRVIPLSVSGAMVISNFALPDSSFDGSIVSSSAHSGSDETGKRSNDETVKRSNDSAWVVMATTSRTMRLVVDDGDTLSVRPEALVAWTGKNPTGFCPKLGVMDLILPRGPKDLLLNFYGPGIVWVEGSQRRQRRMYPERRVW